MWYRRLSICPRVLVGIVSAVVLVSCDSGNGVAGNGDAAVYDLGGPPALPGGGFDYDLTIVYSNDFHDQVLPIGGKRGGMARQATLIRLLREQAAQRGVGLLAANAGDNLEGTVFYDTDGGVLTYRLLEQAGYDVVQVGNHDHQFGAQRLYDILAEAFPGFGQGLRVLWGNVNPSEMSPVGSDPTMSSAPFIPAQVDQVVIDAFENAFVDFATGAIDPAQMDAPDANSKVFNQTLFYTMNGVRIGLFGLDTDEILYTSVPGEGDLFLNADGRSENLRFYSPADHDFASDMVTYLNDPDGNPATDDGADVIVAVTHLGFDVDQDVAAQAVGATGRHVDVIVGGHSHTKINTAFTVTHGDGTTTLIVQAGSRGEFVGRLDLAVDRVLNRVSLRNCQLLQVDDRLEADAATAAMIQQGVDGPTGVNATYGPGTTTTTVTASPAILPGGVPAASALGSLAADACLEAANAAPTALALDAMLIGNFVFRGDLCAGALTVNDIESVLPLHVLDRTGRTNDSVHFIELPGGLREGSDPTTFPLPAPNLTQITALEYFLETAYGIEDILGVIGVFLGLQISGIDRFVEGLQWGGIEFVVDPSAPALHRIDPTTIVINGVPLMGNENSSWRLGINALIAEIALPFFQILTQLEDAPGSGNLVSFPDYDPLTNGTSVVIWQALRDRLAKMATLDPATARVDGGRPRTMAPDLTFNPIDVLVSPSIVSPGAAVTLTVPVLNLGATAASSAVLGVRLDVTPDDFTDNPDGITDALTGAFLTTLANDTFGPVPAHAAGLPGEVLVAPTFTVPLSLPAGDYPLTLRLVSVTSPIVALPESITSNNGGSGFEVILRVQ